MPSSLLWAVDVYGRVCSLSTTGGRWQPYKDVLLELKRVTGAERCCWGIGCDHQVYLNVSPREVSIRHQEETYENQRWNPVEGYTDTLLPTDRWQWTDETGLKPQPLHSFQLPSDNWEWEGDWFVDDESCGSESSRTGGWEYAVDFPVTFSKEKKWNSCVRRRRWLRYRRYKAQGTWAKVPLDKTRAPPEPFIDISCGGWEMGNPKQQLIFLWAVSQQGKVWFRAGIQQLNPEGRFWEQLQVPREVAQVAAGPGDLLWAVLWEGQLLARTGVSKNCPKGSSWEVVDPPNKTGVMNVAVGVNVVWAVTKDNKVWFRRGVNSHNVCGSGWISISGEMVMVSVGPHDQVWGVGSEDRTVYFRNGVTDTEVTGRSWIPVTAQWDRNQSTNQPSVSSDGCVFSGEVTGPSQGSVLGCTDADVPRPSIPKITSDSFISALVSDRPGPQGRSENAPHPAVPEGTPEEGEGEGSAPQTQSLPACQAGGSEPPWSNVDLEEVKSPPPRAVATYPMELGQSVEQEERPPWAWVSGGGCVLDLAQQISWLATSDAGPISPSITPALPAPAEGQAASRHTERHPEQAHETSVRLLKGRISWWRDWLPHQWEEVGVCLEQVSSSNGHRDDVLHIYYTQNEERKFLSTGMREVTALVPVLREGLQALAVYTAQRTRQRWPLLLSTQSEQHMMDWLSSLSGSCCDSRGLWGPPSKQALWSLTSKGDVMVHDPSPSLEAPGQHLPCDQMFWRQIPGHLLCVEANSLGVVWGISYNHTAWVYSGACRGRSSQDPNGDEANTLTDVRNVYVYENQRWNPVTGYTDKGLPTDRYMWSDECGLRQCTKESTQPPSPQWTWVSDWATDYSVPGGTDREGWQYAADFPVSYHGYKTIKDFVRRRRWARKCKITLTGPWLEVPPITLSDITILPCLSQSSMEQVPVWAISEKGDVLCRLGVTIQDPAGSSWLHVGTDQPFKSISIGGGHQVWAIARDGTVFYRGSVSAHNPAGECWYHIPSPLRQSLRQVSVGRTSVYAVDENSNLWYRQGLTPSYPQGSAWELICTNVSKVSVGPLDQVWTIAEKVPGSPAESPGTVCHRLGVRPMQPKGLSWDYGIGGGWQHLSVRGNSMEAQRGLPQSPLPTQRQINGTAGGS